MRVILCFLLALVAAPAWAEWVKVEETYRATHYIDPTRIRKDGNFRKVWQITDLKQRHKDGAMSMRALNEYDCKEERYRILALSFHSGPMAEGETLTSNDRVSEWSATPPNSAGETVLKLVCAPVAAPDLAKWVEVDKAADGSVTFYIDPASIRKDGNLRKVREIQDLKQRETGAMSVRVWMEYDCKEERSRILSYSTHSDPMAGGVTLSSGDIGGEWSAISPGSIAAAFLKRVCAK